MSYYIFLHGVIFCFGCWVIVLRAEVSGKNSLIRMLRGYIKADLKRIEGLEGIIQEHNIKDE